MWLHAGLKSAGSTCFTTSSGLTVEWGFTISDYFHVIQLIFLIKQWTIDILVYHAPNHWRPQEIWEKSF